MKKIEAAFSKRPIPKDIYFSDGVASEEANEVKFFIGRPWSSINCEMLELYHDAIYFFTPEAFCYYLPGILSASINEDQPNILTCIAIVNMLDRGRKPEYWDDLFRSRWLNFTKCECEAVIDWLLWLSSNKKAVYPDVSLSRAFDTLNILVSLR